MKIDTSEKVHHAYRQLEGDVATLFKLVFTHRKPLAESDVRLASVILRKWLVEGLLGQLCNTMGVKPSFFALDNAAQLAILRDRSTIEYFLTGGVRFNGQPVSGVYHSTAAFSGTPLMPAENMPGREFTLGEFVDQERLYFRGNFFTTADIIKFTANKLGGAHYDTNRSGKYAILNEAAQYMMFGGPLGVNDESPSKIYLPLEPRGSEILSGLHIEIIAAATSLIQLRLNGVPVVRLTTKKSWRTRVRDVLGKNKPRYMVYGDVEKDS